jgi:hypothetical protein
MKITTYLAGSIQDTKDGGTLWRDKLTPKLEALGITVLNPCKSECNNELGADILASRDQLRKYKRSGNFESFDEQMRKIIQDDLRQVTESNFLVVYWNNEYKHGGTVHEVAHAWNLHIPVYLVNYEPLTEMNDWILALVRQNGQIFENFGQLVDFIQTRYKQETKEILKERQEAEDKKKKEAEENKKEEANKDDK